MVRQSAQWFERAARGLKPNALFIVDAKANQTLKMRRREIRKVRVYGDDGYEFESRITDMSFLGIFGEDAGMEGDDTLLVRLPDQWFERGANGLKPNTLLVLSPNANAILKDRLQDVCRIVAYNDAGDEFDATLTDLSLVAALGGGFFWVASWKDASAVRLKARRVVPQDAGAGFVWVVSWSPSESSQPRKGERRSVGDEV